MLGINFYFTVVDDRSLTMQSSKANTGDLGLGSKGFLKGVRYEHLFAGVTGGVASTLILHPLDLLKVRFAGENIFTD